MKKLYEKSELTFAIIAIVIMSVCMMFAPELNKAVGIDYLFNAVFECAIAVVLFIFILKNKLTEKYGLCRGSVHAKRFLFFIPLVIIASHNLWNGVSFQNFPKAYELALYLFYMLCVGFTEEVLFRGLLFKAIAKDNVKTAIIISSVTFGLGHILNLLNGVNENILYQLLQIAGAIATGFLFSIIFFKSGSLLPCIITHASIDMCSAFANQSGLTETRMAVICLINMVVTVAFTVYFLKLRSPLQLPVDNVPNTNG